jgi:hypothetical protein
MNNDFQEVFVLLKQWNSWIDQIRIIDVNSEWR